MSSPSDTLVAARDACPICGRAATAAERPFCSRGCRDRDLLRWLDEGYAIPGRSIADEEE